MSSSARSCDLHLITAFGGCDGACRPPSLPRVVLPRLTGGDTAPTPGGAGRAESAAHAGGGVGFVPALRDDAPCRLLGELLGLDAVWIVAPGPTGREVTARWEREAARQHRIGEARLAALVQDIDRRGGADARRPLRGAGRSARRRRPCRRPPRGVDPRRARVSTRRAARGRARRRRCRRQGRPGRAAGRCRLHAGPRSPARADGPPAIAHLAAGVRPLRGRDRPCRCRRARPPGQVSRAAVLPPLGGRATRRRSSRRTARITTRRTWRGSATRPPRAPSSTGAPG